MPGCRWSDRRRASFLGLRYERQGGQEGPEIVRQNDGALSEFPSFQTTAGDGFVDLRPADIGGVAYFRNRKRLTRNWFELLLHFDSP